MANSQRAASVSRRSFLARAAAAGIAPELRNALPAADRAPAPGETAKRRPNFLIFVTDQHNPTCFGYAGHPVVRTPHLDALARRGTYFSRAYVSNPLCLPSRATLFTGLTTRGHGVRMNGIPLDWGVPTMTEALRQAGYRTHCVGKIHLRTSLTPNGVPLDAVDAREFPEARDMWTSGRVRELPSPYYGLESVDYANGHGPFTWGHYVRWIDKEHPREARLFHEKTPLEPPGPAARQYNRECFKWALPQEVHPSTWVADRAIDYLNEAGRRERRSGSDPARAASPFFLWCSIQEPHDPFAPPAPWCYRYDPREVPPPLRREGEFDRLPPHFRAQYRSNLITSGSLGQPMNATDPYRAECAAHYYGLIEMLDHHVGRILEALRRNRLEEDTVVMFVSDHGEALGDHGMWGKGPYHYDGVIRVSCTVAWPGRFKAGRTHAGVISTLDFAPTVLDIAGVPIPQGPLPRTPEAPGMPRPWPGRSLVPVLTGESPPTGATALVEQDEDYLGFRIRTLATDRYRLTAYSGRPFGELFDFHEDPHEYRNLWDEAGRRRLRDELRLELLDKIMDTDRALPRQLCRS